MITDIYPKGSKIDELYELIKSNYYLCDTICKKYKTPNLHECVVRTREYPYINDFIDEYFNFTPKIIEIDINLKIAHGYTPLILASMNAAVYSTEETVKILLKHGANVNEQDNYGRTALIYSIKYSGTFKLENIVKILLENGSNVNIRDNNGITAIMYTLNNIYRIPSINIIKILLKHNADIDLKDNDGDNVITYFFKFSRSENVIDTLLPNRKKFLQKISENKRKILKYQFKFWLLKSNDYRLIPSEVNSFKRIISFM